MRAGAARAYVLARYSFVTTARRAAQLVDRELAEAAPTSLLVCGSRSISAAHFAEGDHPFRRIAITDFASWRSERSDVSL